MTSRERVLAAVAHREPDRVPVDLGSTPSSGISATAYARVREKLGIRGGHVRVYDVVQQLAQPEPWALDRFGVDVVDLGRTFNTRDDDWYDVVLASGEPAQYPVWFHPEPQADGSWNVHHRDGTLIARMPAGAAFFDETCFPYADGWPADWSGLDEAMGKVLWAALVHSPWDNARRPDFWPTMRANALRLRAETDRAIMVVVGCNLFEWGTFLRRLDNFLVDILVEPEKVEGLLDALLERHLATLAKVCEHLGDLVDLIRFGDDLGTDQGPFMEPEVYRRLFKPRHLRLCEYTHAHSRMHTFLHSCGSIDQVLPDLIEAGFEIVNPVQTSCRGMEPERLKREFGREVVFWGGGVDTRTVLNSGSPGDVRRQVLERMEIFAKGGGYVFNTVHNILPDVPPANVLALFDAVAEFNGALAGGRG
ncbi:MAG TPA: uroporphyrinogen decarboxylase family protein [Anaeromyxobacter sp.]|nr:uroporphyrinogen decarboxylase family protein [Anaeromyxobacter sp.]